MRALRFRDNSEEATFELNLAPMMDMFVTIIPFMLLSVVFIQLALIDAPLPVPVANALAQDRAKDKREVSISVNMDQKTGFKIEVKDLNGQMSRHFVPTVNGTQDYKGFHQKLVAIKLNHPKVFRVELNPSENVDYENIVKAMDEARDMRGTDPKVVIEGAESPLLFPDVILSNVMG
ncbi:MAG: biopolymer transporter ExbD [Oligoflexia bacterium]|nr:biopolymer transporter ExbD [Oligoflexia bacterium]